jgi:hypothetical protein
VFPGSAGGPPDKVFKLFRRPLLLSEAVPKLQCFGTSSSCKGKEENDVERLYSRQRRGV